MFKTFVHLFRSIASNQNWLVQPVFLWAYCVISLRRLTYDIHTCTPQTAMTLTRAAVCTKHLNSSIIAWQQRSTSSIPQAHGSDDGSQAPLEGMYYFCDPRLKLTCQSWVSAGFTTPFWRNALLLSLAAAGFYRWAPTPDQDVYLTKWLAQYATPRDFWTTVNEKQLLRSQQIASNTVLQSVAQRPTKVKYRYPQ